MVKKSVSFLFIFSLAVSLVGCIPVVLVAAGGAGTAAWLSQKVVQDVPASVKKVSDAAEYALDSMKCDMTKRIQQKESTQITAAYPDGKTIWIDIRRMGETLSSVEVRVGALSDKDAARKIMYEIAKRSI